MGTADSLKHFLFLCCHYTTGFRCCCDNVRSVSLAVAVTKGGQVSAYLGLTTLHFAPRCHGLADMHDCGDCASFINATDTPA